MRENTYNIPAVKFGIAFFSNPERYANEKDTNKLLNVFASRLHTWEVISIPFDSVDGLTLSEIQDILMLDEGPMFFYSDYNIPEGIRYKNQGIGLVFPKEYLAANPNQPVEDAITAGIEQGYYNMNNRLTTCFLERYKDYSQEKVLERIEKIHLKKLNEE